MPESTSAFPSVTADPSNGDSPTPGPSSQSTSDPALSLRAVALSTLKSKRRKPASTQSQSLLSRPALADNSVQLDYGQDDKDPSSSEVKFSANSKSAPENDGQPREEGEISDSEEAQLALAASGQPVPSDSPPSPSKLSQPSPSLDSNSGYAPISTSLTSVPLKQETTPPPSNLLDRISGPETVPSSSIAHHREASVSTITADDMDIDQSSHFVDENHVRPGLSSASYSFLVIFTHLNSFCTSALVNQAQYDTAKEIILDLLGWGVPPSYLLDCGLSREIIFYVFSELNLRLPDGINPNEFVPYNSTTVAMLVRGVNVPPGGFPNLLPKPMPVMRNGHFATTQMSPMLGSPDSSSLNDMEKQRRQELLARKAVYASRKGRVPRKDTSSMMPSASHGQDVEMASVPTATVDDFLKTIESPDEAPQTHQRDERMVVDPSGSRQENHIQPAQQPSQIVYSPIEPPNSAESHTMDFDPPSRRSSSSTSSSNDTQRRPGKRPVAADFVDFESGPRHRNGHPHPHLKRKQEGSFASVSATRRCVIDLSDDEDGTNDEVGHIGSQGNGYNSPGLAGLTKSETTGYNTPLLPSTATSTPRTMSPGVGSLAEKEKEILKMRQMIAERERSRVVKSLKFKKTNTLMNGEDSQEGAHTPASLVPVKQEEEEMPLHSARPDDVVHTMIIDTSTTATLTTQDDQIIDDDPARDSEASSTASTPPPIGCSFLPLSTRLPLTMPRKWRTIRQILLKIRPAYL
uniref:Uncharacterized protein n=1 Tax=Moniliophthora roreri TaxID=221103 RepID=A0A0W0FUX6_MONRR